MTPSDLDEYNRSLAFFKSHPHLIDKIKKDTWDNKQTYERNKVNEEIKLKISSNMITGISTVKYSEQIVNTLFGENKMYAALITPPQFGKTQIFIDSILKSILDGHINYDCFSIITGLSSKDWISQTTKRVPSYIRESISSNNINDIVCHRQDIVSTKKSLAKKGKSLCKRIRYAIDNGEKFILIIDEGHVACQGSQSMSTFFQLLYHNLCPQSENENKDTIFRYFHKIGIKIVFVSATLDGVKVILETCMSDIGNIIPANPLDVTSYTWMENFRNLGIVRESVKYMSNNNVTKKGKIMMTEIINHIVSNTPGYSLFRPETTHYNEIMEAVTKGIKDSKQPYEIIQYDCEHRNSLCNTVVAINADTDNLEELLKFPPNKHILIFTKSMIRISQTTPTDHVRIMCDRPVNVSNPNISTIIQSFAGRMCGHNRKDHMKNILLFSSIKGIDTYIKLVNNNYNAALTPYTGYSLKKKGQKKYSQYLDIGETYTGDAMILKTHKNNNQLELNLDKPNTTLLNKCRNAIATKNGLAHKIYNVFANNDKDATMRKQEIQDLVDSELNMNFYTTWNKKYMYYKILMKVGDDKYKLNPKVVDLMKS